MTDVQQFNSLREKIAFETAQRRERYARFEDAFAKARAAGLAAGNAAVPTPIIVGQAKSFLSNEIDYTKGPIEYVADGVCGFAWVRVRPANSSFAKWLLKTGKVRGKAYGGGVDIWVSEFGQSMQRKEAFARAFADVIRSELGIDVYPNSRMD